MTRRRRPAPRAKKEVPKGELKQPRPVWFVTLMAFVLPGSGQVFNGAPIRGVIMQFGMLVGGWITYQLTTPDISPIGRLAGGLLVYVFSIVDANGIANRRVKAWARIELEMREKASQKAARGSGGKKRQGVPAGKSGGSGARRTEAGTAPDAAAGGGPDAGADTPASDEPAAPVGLDDAADAPARPGSPGPPAG